MAETKKLFGAAKIAHEKKLARESAKKVLDIAKKNKVKKVAKPTVKPSSDKEINLKAYDVDLDNGTITRLGKKGEKLEVRKISEVPMLKGLFDMLGIISDPKKICLKKSAEPIKKLNALHPVFDHRNMMSAFFGKDNDVAVTLLADENGTPMFNIVVAGCEHKAEAMRRLLNGTFVIGNKTYKLLVNGKAKSHKDTVTLSTIATAFAGNSLYSRIYVKYNPDKTIDKWCILWKKEAVAFPNDQLNSYCGMECHSAEDLARSVLHGKVNSVMMHATDVGEYNGYWDVK